MSRRRVISYLAVATAAGLVFGGCATGEDSPGPAGTAPDSAAPSTSSAYDPGSSSSARRPAPGPAMDRATAALAKAYGSLNQRLADVGANQKVAIAILPVGSSAAPIEFGDTRPPQVAWSTIKVPLVIAAERHHRGPMPASVAAITRSDNNAAQSLWASLGTDEQAAAAVTAVLRDGGDRRSRVPSTRKRPPYTIFGQTVWRIDDAARFTAGLVCFPDGERVKQLMGKVDGDQRWGAERMRAQTFVKGGWGPGTGGGYTVRQLALIRHRDGAQTAVAMVTFGPGTTMSSGTAALNHVGSWLDQQARHLPRGFC
ncbi:hypothetical protein GOARA_021_00020 [Gordonia araii NBRC 100433]|uniref:Serine hydrolase n=1 Tax=Gordonia araii NBRC 100433 TaxID=1073574 RepID=G7GYT9_9ACTN|nr:hypothetical protein [Gordonia araii]NNG96975.1 hypothetical protein [Gordonia araii NBRC 100433]GAB08764.1 hypothetical protein GOARA_021_00020 [Gordonia araii NBRC 100433]